MQQMIRSGILTALLLAAVVSGVQGATLAVSPSGGDYTTLQPAVDAASPGDTIEVQAGTYPGDVVVRTPVTLLGTDGVTVGTGGEQTAFIIEADGVTISGFTCDGPAIGIIANASEASRVRGCTIVAGDTGIVLSGCTDCSVEDTSILAERSGILVMSSEMTEIQNAWVNGGTSGVTLRNADDFALIRTTLLGCDVGIVAERCGNGTIEEMSFTDVDAGFLGIGITDLRITGSTISNMVQYGQVYNALRCRVDADSLEGAEYFAADVFSDTVYACGPWAVTGWNYALERANYTAPEDFMQFGDALRVSIIEEAESLTDPFILMDAEVSAAELEGYDAETFGFYRIDGGVPVPVGMTTAGEDGSAVASANSTAAGDFALLAKVKETGPDLFYVFIGLLVLIAVVLGYLVFRRE